MDEMAQNNLPLAEIFQAVTQALNENQATLDQADAYNQNHGSNMVQTFQAITNALQKKKGSSGSAALRYAAQQLSKTANSGSGKLYAENLAQAAVQFKGKPVDSRGALQLLQTLISGEQTSQSSSQPGGDLLGSILEMAGSSQPSDQQTGQASGSDMLGTLLGGLTGGGSQPTPQSPQPGADSITDLLGSLMGGGQASVQTPAQTSGGDLLGSLLGSLTGGGEPSAQSPTQTGGELLGSLLGGLTGGGDSSTGGQNESGAGNLMNAALAFFQAKQSGGNTTQALVQAFMAANRMGDASHRAQSTQVVIESFLQALNASASKK
jgi:hypothetical protein